MKKLFAFIVFFISLNSFAQIPFQNLVQQDATSEITEKSPKCAIDTSYWQSSVFIKLKAGDAIYVTASSKDNVSAYFKNPKNNKEQVQISKTNNAWMYYKASKNEVIEIFGIYKFGKYNKGETLKWSATYLLGNAKDFYFPNNNDIPSKIRSLAYGKSLSYLNLYYSRNCVPTKKDTTFKSVFTKNDQINITGNQAEYFIAKNISKEKALALIPTWSKYIITAFQKIEIEDKQEYNETEMIANGYPEIIYSAKWGNYEQLNFVDKAKVGSVEIFTVKLIAEKNSSNSYDVKLLIR